MARYPEKQIRSSTHHLTPFAAADGSEVQQMPVSCVMLRGQPRSCRPNLRGMVTCTSYPEMWSCSRVNKRAEYSRNFINSTTPVEILYGWTTAARVNGARERPFTLLFTDPFTLKASISQREHIGCAQHEDGFGRGQNTGLGWSDPIFGQMLVAKRPQGSLQPSTLVA